jgi:hypothetical protein
MAARRFHAGRKRKRPSETGNCPLVRASLDQDNTQGIMGPGMARCLGNGGLQLRRSRFMLALTGQHLAEVDLRLDIAGVQRQCTLQIVACGGEIAQGAMHGRPAVPKIGNRSGAGDCAIEKPDRVAQAALLIGENAGEVESVRVSWVEGEGLGIKRLGPIEGTGAMLTQGLTQHRA